MVDIKIPPMGESISEAKISRWIKKMGEEARADEPICELETDKATVEVTAPINGTVNPSVPEGSMVKIGQVIGSMKPGVATPAENTAKKTETVEPLDPGPAVRKALAENPALASTSGSGKGGRVTKEDLLKPAPSASTSSGPVPAQIVFNNTTREERREPMSMLRRTLAERLVKAQHTAAILTTFNEIDMSAINTIRDKYKDDFQKKHNLKLGFMGFFLKASVAALKQYPLVNAYIDGTNFCYHNYCDIGVAVSTPKGLMVPVIKDVDKMSIAQIESEIARFSIKARDGKISIDDLKGGTFTVSNGGIFGSLLSTPIINPPQTAILGMHKIQNRPVVLDNGSIVARPMMYLALSYDHRVLDGKEAVGFLVAVKNALEDPARLLLEV